MSGKINRDKMRSHEQDEIDREVARERASLGLKPRASYSKAYNIPVPDVHSIRQRLGMSQNRFARQFKISHRTIQQWEQRRSLPDQPSRLLLRIIELYPDVAAHAASIEEMQIVRRPLKTPKLAGEPSCHAPSSWLDNFAPVAKIKQDQNASEPYAKEAS